MARGGMCRARAKSLCVNSLERNIEGALALAWK